MDSGLVRFGILGCARIARKLSRAILMTPGACLYAIGSRSLEKAQGFAQDNGFPAETKIYASYQGLLEDEAVDAVYIPLPTALHVEWVLKAAEKKKHVLLEKPLSITIEDLENIISACEKQGIQLMDGTMWMHHPRADKMKEVLNNKHLFGDLVEGIIQQTCRKRYGPQQIQLLHPFHALKKTSKQERLKYFRLPMLGGNLARVFCLYFMEKSRANVVKRFLA